MAELQDPAYLGEGCITAQGDRQVLNSFVCTEGVTPGRGDELLVIADTPASMDVEVGSGSAFIAGTDIAWQGMYHVSNDSAVTLTIGTADPTDDRIDIIVATVRDNETGGGGLNEWELQVVAGTPSPAPSPPATPDNSLVLAQILVEAATADITSGDITDTRTYWESCTSAGGTLLDTLVFTTSDTFVKADYPSGSQVDVEVIGSGGGGGGASNSNNSFGAGGGSGAYCRGLIPFSSLAASETVTVASGGAGGVGNASGSNGGTSSFGTHISCAGGQGGAEDSGTNVAAGGNSGAVGTSPADAIEVEGQDGEYAWGSTALIHSGTGANSPLGLGGMGRTFGTSLPLAGDGRPGTGYGSGGGGAHNGTVGPQNGGDGADGVVIVRVYG